ADQRRGPRAASPWPETLLIALPAFATRTAPWRRSRLGTTHRRRLGRRQNRASTGKGKRRRTSPDRRRQEALLVSGEDNCIAAGSAPSPSHLPVATSRRVLCAAPPPSRPSTCWCRC